MGPPQEADATEGVRLEIVKLYFQHQFDRFSKIESGNHSLSNMTVALSAGIFVAIGRQGSSLDFFGGVIGPSLMIIGNIFAILYIRKGYEYMIAHHARAYEVLYNYAPDLQDISKKHPVGRPRDPFGRTSLHRYMHYVMIVVSLVLLGMYVWSDAGSGELRSDVGRFASFFVVDGTN